LLVLYEASHYLRVGRRTVFMEGHANRDGWLSLGKARKKAAPPGRAGRQPPYWRITLTFLYKRNTNREFTTPLIRLKEVVIFTVGKRASVGTPQRGRKKK